MGGDDIGEREESRKRRDAGSLLEHSLNGWATRVLPVVREGCSLEEAL